MLSGSFGVDFVINLYNLLHNESWGGGGDGDGDGVGLLRSNSCEYHKKPSFGASSVLGKEIYALKYAGK
jgi:hypothetical protein